MEIFKLFGSVFIDNEKADKSIDETDKKGQGLAGTLTKTIGTAAKWGAGIFAAGSVAVGGMLALANKTAAAADEIDKLSERTGINREELQRWKYAAGQSGADVGKLEVGIKKLSDVMDGAANGNKANAEAFDKLGISLTDANGKARSTESVFADVMNKMGDMEQGAARNALGNDLLGKSYTEMLPLLNAGSGGMKDLKDRADELGLVMSEDAVKANVKFGDTMDDMKQSIGAVFMHISNGFLPILQTLIDFILLHMPEIQAVFSVVFEVIGTLFGWFAEGIKTIISWVGQWSKDNDEKLGGLKVIFMEFFEAVKNLISGFVEFAIWFWNIFGDSIMSIVKFVFDIVSTYISTTFKIIADIFNIFAALFRGDWEGLWKGVKKFFLDIWDGIYSGLKGTINLIIRAINGMIGHLNNISFIVPEWVPIIGGKGWGFNLPRIPELAKGGVITESGRVRVGENGPEELYLPEGAKVVPLSEQDTQGTTINNYFQPGAIVIPTKDLEEMRTIQDFFDRLPQVANALGG